MKYSLTQNVKVIPYITGTALDREGYLTAIFGISVTAGEKVKITVTHGDTETGTFDAVDDKYMIIGGSNEVFVTAPGIINFDLDLVGCKRFIKIDTVLTGTGAVATYAVALGDKSMNPV